MYVGCRHMSCATPIDPGILADYWLAELSLTEESAVEEHIFACVDCARQLQFVMDLTDSIRTLARQGNLGMIITREFLDRLTKEGRHAREYPALPGGTVECTVT